MRVRYSTKHTISLALLTLLLCSLFLPLRNVFASPDSETLRPNAAGYSAGLHPVPVGTPNWDCVDETPANDSDYVSTDTTDQLPELDLHNIANTTIGTSDTIYNVTVNLRLKSQSNSYKATFFTAIRTEGTNYLGSAVYPTTTWATYSKTYTTNPNTGANWTVQELNDLQIGVDGYSGKDTYGAIKIGLCSQVWCDIFFIPVSGKAWHDVSSWTASLVTKAWSSGTSWTANLIIRTWSSETSFSLNLPTRIWSSVAFFGISTELIDSYSESNYNYTSYVYHLHPSDIVPKSAEGQSFTMLSSDHMITSCKFYLCKTGSPTGMAHAVLYAHQGIYGTNSTPTGEALATSDDFDVSTLTTSYQLITFTFNSSQQYLMKANIYYCIAFENPTSGTIDFANCPLMGFDHGSPTHSGSNFLYYNSSYFPAFTSFDTVFYVYGKLVGFNLLTRQYVTVASWLFDFGTRIWVDAATWTYNWVTMAWENISWIFYLGTSIWKDIATWVFYPLTRLWNDIAVWAFDVTAMMWRDLTWLFYLLPPLPQWVNVAVWIFSLRSAEWMLVALWNLQLGGAEIAFLFIAILLLIVIVAGIIAIAYRRQK